MYVAENLIINSKPLCRYFIVIDDIWEIQDWETIKLALDCDNNSSGTIIITTRNLEVATIAGDVYKLQPLPYDESRELFFRIYGHEGKFGGHWSDDVTDKFIWKCDGIPLAIIAMASLLVRKQREEWYKLYKTFDFCRRGNMEAQYAMMILSSSYKDLPSHLRICLLYLSGFPEDYVIPKDSLVWKWVAEGFIIGNQESRLFEIGEGYFNDLVNRSLIEAVESDYHDNIVTGCRVPIMVLHFIRFMSREENFFTLVDDNQDTLLHSNVRRLASHNRTIGHTNQTKHIEMPKVRSFAALGCLIETWAPHSSFTLLRVVAIENCNPMDGCHRVRVEHLGHLLHLRFLSLRGTRTEKIPEKIGALRFLQMLDLWESNILELPSNNSLPRQMLCLRITFHDAFDAEVPSLETLKSLEELAITGGPYPKAARRWLEDLGSLTELRVLHASGILFDDEETERTFGESLRHLHKLQHLTIIGYDSDYQPRWQATEFVLSRHLQHLAVYNVLFCKLPSCINPSCLGNLSHLNLKVEYMDEYDLKILGLLPELGFLELELWSSITITNFSDSDTVYFSKLTCCRLTRSMVFFCENEADRTVSFHIDIDDLESGHGDECESDSSSDDEWESESGDEFPGPMPSSMCDDGLYGDDELQMPTASVSDEELNKPPPFQHSKLQYGLAALAYYLLAFFRYVLAFVKKWSSKQVVEQPLISSLGSCHGNGEDPIAIAMTSTISSDEDKGSICGNSTEAPRFMPTLQVLGFQVSVRTMPMREDHHYCDNLGLEYFASLRKVEVCILPLPRDTWGYERDLEAALRRAVQVHPNRPTLHFL